MTAQRHGTPRPRRRWPVVLAVAAASLSVVALAVALLHTPTARAYAWDFIVAHARRSLDLEVRATSFRYNLARLSVSATDLELASARAPRTPFFAAHRVDARLSWRALTGAIDLDSLVVERPRIDLRPLTDGTLNVPVAGGNTGPAAVPVFSLRELRVTGLDMTAGMRAQELAFTARGVEVAAAGARPRWLEGTVSFRHGAVLELGTSRIPVERADARVTFDGETIALPAATAILGGGPLLAGGRATVFGPSPGLDLTFDWRPDAARVSAWNDAWPELAGQVHVRARATGALRDPRLAVQLESRDLGWSSIRSGSLTGRATVTTGGFEIEAFEARTARGLVRGAGVLAFERSAQSLATVDWSDVDPAAFASVLPPALARVRDVRSAGLATLRWSGVPPSLATVDGTLRLALTPAGPRHLGRTTVTATGDRGSWRIEARQQLPGETDLDGTARVLLDAARWQRSSLAGRVTVRSIQPLALLDHARAIGLPVAVPDGIDAAGPLSLQAAVSGSLGDPRAAGDLSLDGIDLRGATGWNATATFTADSRAIGFAPLTLTGPASRVEARGTLGLSGQGSGDVLMTVGDLGEVLESVPVAWRPRGAVRATGGWSGTVRRPRVALDIEGSALSLGGTRADALTGHIVYDEHVIHLERLDLQQSDGGRLHASGRVDTTNGLGAISAEGRALRIGPVALGSGEPQRDAVSADGVAVSLELEGSHRNPRGAATITASTLRWGDRQIDGVDLSLQAHDVEPPLMTPGPAGAREMRAARQTVADITARVPAFNATLSGTVALASPYAFSARTSVDDLDVEKVLRFWRPGTVMPAETDGRIRVLAEHTGELAGDPLASARVELGAFDGRLLGVPVVLARPARIDFEGGDVLVRDAALDVGGLALRASGATGPETVSPLVIDLDGRLDTLRPWLKNAEPGHAWDAGGHVTGRLELGRRNGGLRIAGLIETTDVQASRDGVTVASGVAARATVHEGALHVDRLSGAVFGGSIDGTASIPVSWVARGLSPTWQLAPGTTDGPAKLRAHARIDLPRVLGVLMRREFPNVTGSVDATLEATALRPALDAVVANLVAERVVLGVFDDGVSQVVPTRASFANGRLVVEALDWKGPRSRLTAEGAIGLASGSSTDLRVGADLGFRLLDLMVPGRAVGRGRVDLHIVGGPGNHRVTGAATLTEAGLLLPGSRFALAGWNGGVEFSTEGLYARSLRGQLNGGDITIEGRLPLGTRGTPGEGQEGLTLTANGVFLEVPEGLRSQADARLEWQREGERSTIQGRVTLMSSSYREPVTRMLQLVDALSPSATRGSSTPRLPAFVTSTTLDVSLDSSDPVVFENSLGRVEMIPRMRVVGSLAAPALAGSVEALDDGRLRIAGRTYRLTESSLRFSPADGLAPTLNLSGETRIGEYDVVLRVTGTPGRIETNFSSTPPLGERDLRSLVVTGRTENADLQGASGDQFAVGAASSDVLGFAGKFVGLDSVRLGAADLELVSTDVRPSQHLTVSKSLGRQFEVIASENLDDNKLTWVFVWRPARNYQFRVASRENTDQSIEFRQELQFGPGARASAAPRSSGHARPRRVTRVVLDGQPGFDQAELLDVLDLSTGDVFDFRKWLADRDRLEEFYRERGYFAARIVPTRREVSDVGGAPGVELVYVVQRNRRTTLEVVGDELPARAVEQMKLAWGETPVVEFLRDDLVRIARAALSADGYLRAQVDTTVVEESATTVTLRVTVARGPKSSRRELVFAGNASVASHELQRFITARNLEQAAWTDPTGCVRALEDFYALRGFLRAEVRIGEPVFEGDVATLPVRVTEGPAARVERVTLAGIATSREDAARQALGVTADTPYVVQLERAGQRRLEEYYRDLGFRDARVAVRPTVSEDGARVALDVQVSEGPLHRVRDVKVTGVESANASMVQKAIAVQPGSPASQSDATRSRQRLYETGVFRSADIRFEPVTSEQDAALRSERPVDAIVALEESRRYLLRYGLEFAREYDPTFEHYTHGVGLSADVRDRNFLGRGIALGLGGRYDPSLHSVRGILSFPRMWQVPVRTNATIAFRSETTSKPGFKLVDDRNDFTLDQRWRAASHLELTWGYAFADREFTIDTPERALPEITLGGVLAGLIGSAVIDYRDSPFDATRGWFHSSSIQLAMRALGSDFGYTRYLLRQYHYQPVGPLTLAGAARWGTIATGKGVPPITVLDILFKAGGTTTVRGYAEESLSATEFLGVPIGGTELLVLNGEVRFPLAGWFKGVVFADAGNAFTGQSDFAWRDLAVGLGFGLRVKTPLAPIRIDLGFPVPQRSGMKSPRLHFSIGQMF